MRKSRLKHSSIIYTQIVYKKITNLPMYVFFSKVMYNAKYRAAVKFH